MIVSGASPRLTPVERELAAGGALWREGLVPEAHAAVMRAFRLMLDAWGAIGATAEPAAGPLAAPVSYGQAHVLAALTGAGYPRTDRLGEALAAGAEAGAGAGAEPSPTGARRSPPDLEWIWAEAERLWRFTARHFKSDAARRRTRIRATIGVVALGVLALAFAGRAWLRPRVSASGVYSPEFPASYAVDGIETTEWMLPDRAPGWLQISFPFARRIRSVRILNGHNRYYMDRAAQEVRVTAFSDKGQVGATAGRFSGLTADRSVLDLPLDAAAVTHLRVEVLSYFGKGGAIAEVEAR